MEDIVTRCGYKCNLCLAYKGNIKSHEDQQKISDGWFKYYGFRIPPEDICCDGCLTKDCDNPNLIDKGCPVRPCVNKKGLDNCACCGEYSCKDLETRMVDFKSIEDKYGKSIPIEDYENFIKPYESKKVLDCIKKKKNITNR